MLEPETRLDLVASADGTRIAVHRRGEGPPLLLVHGALTDHSAWAATAPFLTAQRELLMPDRRGRGMSGDADEYKYELEVDDLFAAVMGLHREVDVFGHSSGAILALRAAERGLPIRRLILYEPPFASLRFDAPIPANLADRLTSLVRNGEREAATAEFLRLGVGLEEAQVQRLQSGARWQSLVLLAHTLAYDAHIAAEYELDPRRLRTVTVPVLLLVGELSPPWIRDASQALVRDLPSPAVVELPGQDHNAMVSAPELLAGEVLRFLE